MPVRARYVHTNLVARDWRALAAFYERVFGCTPVPPERALSGPWLERATGLNEVQIRGVHLRLPGHGESGPTLEVFQYSDLAAAAQA
ncbi:MAG: VOC family protein, partial [Anaerolineae bacterium]